MEKKCFMNFIAKGAKIHNIRYVMYQQKKNWQHYYTSDKVYKYIPCYISSSVPLYVFCLHPSWHVPNERTNQGRNCFFIAGQQTDRNTYYFGGLLAVGFNRGEDSFLSVDRQDGAKQPGANTNSLIEKKRSALKTGLY